MNKKDPIAEAAARHAKAVAKMAKLEPKQPKEKKPNEAMIAMRRRLASVSGSGWMTPFMAFLGVCLIAFVLHRGTESINRTLTQNQRQQTFSDIWRELLAADVKVMGTPTRVSMSGEPSFPTVSFEEVRSKLDLHRYLRLAGALPGIRNIDLSPDTARTIGRGVADNDTLEIVATNFPTLDSLDLSGTRVTSLEPIADITVRRLKLINTPIRSDKLASLQYCDSLTDLWIGWDVDKANSENETFRSDRYRAQLLDVLGKVKSLKNLYLYQTQLTPEEKKLIPGLNLNSI